MSQGESDVFLRDRIHRLERILAEERDASLSELSSASQLNDVLTEENDALTQEVMRLNTLLEQQRARRVVRITDAISARLRSLRRRDG